MKNPALISALDSLLADYLNPKQRRLLHSLIALSAALFALWFAAKGDWEQFVLLLGPALYAAANRANTSAVTPEEAEEISGQVSGNPEPGPYEDEEADEPLFTEDEPTL